MWQSEIERKKERQGMQQTRRDRDEKYEEAVKEQLRQKERMHMLLREAHLQDAKSDEVMEDPSIGAGTGGAGGPSAPPESRIVVLSRPICIAPPGFSI